MPRTLGLTGIEAAKPQIDECGLRPLAILNAAAGGAFDGAAGAALSRSTRSTRGAGRAGLGTAIVSALHETGAQVIDRSACRASAVEEAQRANEQALEAKHRKELFDMIQLHQAYGVFDSPTNIGYREKLKNKHAQEMNLFKQSPLENSHLLKDKPVGPPITYRFEGQSFSNDVHVSASSAAGGFKIGATLLRF